MAAEDRNPLDVAGDEDEAKSASAAGDAEAKAADVGPTKSAYEIAEERGEQRAHLKIDEHKARQATPTSVRVLLSAEAKDGGNFGTCLRSIEAHGLGDGLPLMVFKGSIDLSLDVEVLKRSPYCLEKLDGEWKEKSAVEFSFGSLNLAEAFRDAFDSLSGSMPTIRTANQFHLYSAASTLGIDDLQKHCEKFVTLNMSPTTFITAVEHAQKFDRHELVGKAYRWLKRNGATPIGRRGAKQPKSSTQAALDVATGAGGSAGGGGNGDGLYYDASSTEFVCGDHRIKADIFNEFIDDEVKRKDRFFQAGYCGTAAAAMAGEEPDDVSPNEEEPPPAAEGEDEKPAKPASKKGFPGLHKCTMERIREAGPNGDETHFIVRRDCDQEVVVAACTSDGTTFILSLDPENFRPMSPSYVAQMTSNFSGTTFTVHDHGISTRLLPHSVFPKAARREHAVVMYTTNILGRVPNAMTVVTPRYGRVDEEDRPDGAADEDAEEAKQSKASSSKAKKKKPKEIIGALQKELNRKRYGNINRFETKKPKWSKELDAWTMDFKGRVKLASKKNFQLVLVDDPDTTVMLFGKVTKTRFSIDYAPPLTIVQALCVALSSFADKLMVT